jgi:hypothetical protein
MQRTMTDYEQNILSDMQELSEREQLILVKIFRLIKQEFIASRLSEKQITEEFLSVCGTWEDERSVDEQISVIYSARKSTMRTEKVF